MLQNSWLLENFYKCFDNCFYFYPLYTHTCLHWRQTDFSIFKLSYLSVTNPWTHSHTRLIRHRKNSTAQVPHGSYGIDTATTAPDQPVLELSWPYRFGSCRGDIRNCLTISPRHQSVAPLRYPIGVVGKSYTAPGLYLQCLGHPRRQVCGRMFTKTPRFYDPKFRVHILYILVQLIGVSVMI